MEEYTRDEWVNKFQTHPEKHRILEKINSEAYPYKNGSLFLGVYEKTGYEIGIKTERHAITFAGSRSGKGVSVIIPNIKKWPYNLLVIDPKGENARETVADREAMGQNVYVIDPFDRSKVDSRFIASFNPMQSLNLKSPTVADDITAIADGIVMRSGDPSADNWDNGGQELIAGVIAFSLLEGDKKNLAEVRDVISENELLTAYAEQSKNDKRLGGLLRAGASRVLAKEGQYYVSNAQKNTSWLDREPIQKSLEKSSFDLSELKNGKASIYLVLPADYLVSYGRLLRMFVRCSITEMARPTPEGNDKGERCLFILDEFFSLGHINEIAVSSGLMAGNNLQLWPFLQDIGQLTSLYGREGAETYFSNADVHQFFGNSDINTLKYMSELCGNIGVDELSVPPEKQEFKTKTFSLKDSQRQQLDWQTGEENISRLHQNEMARLGKPRIPQEEMAKFVAKQHDVVANSMFCNVYGSHKIWVKPLPFFRKITDNQLSEEEIEDIESIEERRSKNPKRKRGVMSEIIPGVWLLFKFAIFIVMAGMFGQTLEYLISLF